MVVQLYTSSSVFNLIGSRSIEGYHMCSSEFIANADYDTVYSVHLQISNHIISTVGAL